MIRVSKASNHPPSITKNIPKSIGRRLNTISSSEAEFNNAKDDYQQALSEAGYSEMLTYDPEQRRSTRGTKNCRRNIVWFNPPYSRNVATNIGKEFFDLLRIHFPVQHPLHRLFNRNTAKLSYSCTMNLDSIIKAHNAKILRRKKTTAVKTTKPAIAETKQHVQWETTAQKTTSFIKPLFNTRTRNRITLA